MKPFTAVCIKPLPNIWQRSPNYQLKVLGIYMVKQSTFNKNVLEVHYPNGKILNFFNEKNSASTVVPYFWEHFRKIK